MGSRGQTLDVSSDRDGERLILRVCGELDLSSAPRLEEHLAQAHADGVREVVLDLGEMAFMDSTGLSLLLDTHRRMAAAGQHLILRDVTGQPWRLLELTCTTEVLIPHAT